MSDARTTGARENEAAGRPYVPPLGDLLAPERSALLVVDVQHHFLSDDVAVGVSSFLIHLEQLIAQARKVGVPCIFVRAVQTPEGNTRVWVSRHASKPERLGNQEGTQASQFHPRIQPIPGETVVTKLRYSAFLGTDLEAILRRRGIDSLLITGVQSDVCVAMTAAEAFQRDFWTVTVSDCTTTRSTEDHARAMRHASRNWGIVVDSADIINAWEEILGGTQSRIS